MCNRFQQALKCSNSKTLSALLRRLKGHSGLEGMKRDTVLSELHAADGQVPPALIHYLPFAKD